MDIKYPLKIHDSAYNYNIEQSFSEFGHFVTKRRGYSRKIIVNGILRVVHLHIYLILYYDDSSVNFSPLFGTISGTLNNGLKVQIGPRYKTLDHGYYERFPIEKYLIHSVQISDVNTSYAYKMLGLKNVTNIKNNGNKIIYNHNKYHWFIYLSGLSEWSYYNNKDFNKNNKFLDMKEIKYQRNTYNCGILFFTSKYSSINNTSRLTVKRSVLELSSTYNSNISDIINIAKKFCSLFSLFMNKSVIIDNIIKIIGNNVHNILFNMLNSGINSLSDFPLTNTLYLSRIHKYMNYTRISILMKVFFMKYNKLSPLIDSFSSNFNRSISNKTNLQKCVDGIGSYFNGAKYKTNHKSMSLTSKLSNCFMWKFASMIQNKVLGMSNKNQIKKYAQKIADTRNNLDHHDNRFEGDMIDNYPLTLHRLHCLDNCYILNKLGASKELIYNFVDNMDSFN